MSRWPLHTIRDIANGLYDGPHATPAPADKGPVFLGIGNVTEDGHLDLSNVRHIAEEDFGKWTKRVVPQPGDIVFTYEATLNRYAIIPQGFRGCLGRRMALIRPDAAKVDTRFLFYSFFSSEWRDTIETNRLSGATVDRIPLTKFPGFPIRLPPLDTQRGIASILRAYDDLIEVNRRRVAVLEEMARKLFEEWFVRFRFPGHERVSVLDTPHGRLPEGWRVGPLRDVALLKSGFAFKSSTFVEDGRYSLVTIKHVHDGRLVPPFESKLVNPPSNMPVHCYIGDGDMLLSLTGNVGRVCLAWGDGLLLNQRVAKIEAVLEDSRAFAYGWLRQTQTLKLLQQIANGVAQQNLSPVRTMELPIVIPPPDLTCAFGKIGGPVLDAIVVANRTISTLQNQRDLLLPRLVSGQLVVAAAEGELEGAA